MAVKDQRITDEYCLYNGDCIEVMGGFPDGCVTSRHAHWKHRAVPTASAPAPSAPSSIQVCRNALCIFAAYTQGISRTEVAWTSPVSNDPIPVKP